MTLPQALRQLIAFTGLGLALGTTALPASAGAARAERAPLVRGLIVQLHDAPSHVALAQARERALALGANAQANANASEAARWQRLVSGLRGDGDVLRELPQWAAAAPRRDPVGASAQVLHFAQTLTAEQAERVAARIVRSNTSCADCAGLCFGDAYSPSSSSSRAFWPRRHQLLSNANFAARAFKRLTDAASTFCLNSIRETCCWFICA